MGSPDLKGEQQVVWFRLSGLEDCEKVAREASARLEKVGIEPGITERPLRDFLDGLRRMNDPWPERIALFGEPAKLPSEQPTLSFQFPTPEMPSSLAIKGSGLAIEAVEDHLNELGCKLIPEGIYIFSSYVPTEEPIQTTVENFQILNPGSILALALAR